MKVSALNRRLMLPLLLSGLLFVTLVGIADYLLLRWLFDAFRPMLLPVVLLLADETFVVGRTGLLVHHHARHTQAGLREFLVGNGAKQFEALLPYYRHVLGRTLTFSLWRWLFVTLLVVLPCAFAFLFGGLPLLSAVALWLLLMVSMMVCAVCTLLLSMFLYDRWNR